MVLALLSAGCGAVPDSERSRSPNIVFVLVDDLGWSGLPSYGNEFHETPNIDRLVADGMRFTNAYAAASVCSPTRASIQSGQYPPRVGVTDFITGHWRPYEELRVPTNRTQYLPPDVLTVGELMQEAGYVTGFFGKWHLGNEDEAFLPHEQGYDSMLVSRGGGHFDMQDNLTPTKEVAEDEYLADILTDESVEFIMANSGKPFFLFLSHYAVHVPLQAEEKLIEKYRRKEEPDSGVNHPIYAAMVEHVDQSVGRILKTLDAEGIAGNTLVIFYSDNGAVLETFYSGEAVTTNAPLRAGKGYIYEGGIRVPLIVRWPGVVEPGTVSEDIITSADILPTVAEAAGMQEKPDAVIDGRSIVPALKAERNDRERSIYWHYPHYHFGDPAGAVRSGDYKLIEFFDDGQIELYNLREDIGEQNNLVAERPEKAREMQEDLAAWRASVGAEMPVDNPEFDPERRHEWGTHPDK